MVAFGEEDGLAADAALGDVVRNAGRNDSCFTGHMTVWWQGRVIFFTVLHKVKIKTSPLPTHLALGGSRPALSESTPETAALIPGCTAPGQVLSCDYGNPSQGVCTQIHSTKCYDSGNTGGGRAPHCQGTTFDDEPGPGGIGGTWSARRGRGASRTESGLRSIFGGD